MTLKRMVQWTAWLGLAFAARTGDAAVVAIIDRFDDGFQTMRIVGGAGDHRDSAPNGALGGEREVHFFVTENPILRSARMQIANTGDPTLRVDFGPLVVGGVELGYRGLGGGGLGGVDLTTDGAAGIAVQMDFLDVPTRITVELVDTTGAADLVTLEHPGQLYERELFFFPYSEFAIDPQRVDSIGIGFATLGGGGDVVATLVGTATPPAIPEPSSLLALVFGGGLLVMRRRR